MSEGRTTGSLSFQLVSRTVGAISICLAVAFIGLYLAIESVIDGDLDDDMYEDIGEFRVVFAQGGDDAVINEMTRETLGDDSKSVFLRYLDGNNQLVHSTDMQHWMDVKTEHALVARLAATPAEAELTTVGIDTLDTDARIIIGHIGPDRVLQIGESFESRDDIMELLIGTFAFVFLAALPVAGVLGWMATRRATHGIKAVSDAAKRIQGGNLDSRVSIAGTQSNEIQFLANSFNSMANRINSSRVIATVVQLKNV